MLHAESRPMRLSAATWLLMGMGMAIGMVGCGGEPRIDASSLESAQASIAAIAEGLPPEERRVFEADIAAALTNLGAKVARRGELVTRGMMESAMEAQLANPYRILHGLTRQDIRARLVQERHARTAESEQASLQ